MAGRKVFGAALLAAGCFGLAATAGAAFTVTFQDGATTLTIVDNDANDQDKTVGAIQTFGDTVPVSGPLGATEGVTVGGYRVGYRATLNDTLFGPPGTGLSIGTNAGNAIRNVSSANDLVITVEADDAGLAGPGDVGDTYTVTNGVSFSASNGLNDVTTTTQISDGGVLDLTNVAVPNPPTGGDFESSQGLYVRTSDPFFFRQVTTVDLNVGGGTQLTTFSDFYATPSGIVPAPGGLALAAAALPLALRLRRRKA